MVTATSAKAARVPRGADLSFPTRSLDSEIQEFKWGWTCCQIAPSKEGAVVKQSVVLQGEGATCGLNKDRVCYPLEDTREGQMAIQLLRYRRPEKAPLFSCYRVQTGPVRPRAREGLDCTDDGAGFVDTPYLVIAFDPRLTSEGIRFLKAHFACDG